MVDGKVRVFTSRKLTDFNLKPPEKMKLGKANYVSILKRKQMEHSLLDGQLDFDPNLFGGKIGKTLIDINENYHIPEHHTPSPAREKTIQISAASGKCLS